MTSIAQTPVEEQLAMLRQMTRITGALHEAQVQQLRIWPFVIFQWIPARGGMELRWDINSKRVHYTLKARPRAKVPTEKQLAQPVERLNLWIQELLGPDWIVVVSAPGRKMMQGQVIVKKPAPKVVKVDAEPGREADPAD